HRAAVRVEGGVPELVEEGRDEVRTPRSCAEAIELGRSLSGVVIHAEAPRDIDRLDQSPDSELWGQRIWVHLRALDAYAKAKGPGFETWCRSSGSSHAISPKFISMSESETVRNGMAGSRLFPVDTAIDPSGQVHMWAH